MEHPQWISCEKRVKLYGVMYAETLQKRRHCKAPAAEAKGLLQAG
jgi:hypothetical protein